MATIKYFHHSELTAAQSRIAELEKQNAVYREALYSIIGYPSYSNHKIHEPLKAIAEQALNSKEG